MSRLEAFTERRRRRKGSIKTEGNVPAVIAGVPVVTLDESGAEVMDISVAASDISIHPILNSTMVSSPVACSVPGDDEDVLQLEPSADELSL